MCIAFLKMALDFVSSIAWPLIVAVVFYWLRDPIKKFIDNIKSVSHGDIRVERGIIRQDSSGTRNRGVSQIDPTEILRNYSTTTNEKVKDIIQGEVGLNHNSLVGAESLLYDYARLILVNKFFDKQYSMMYGSQLKILFALKGTSQSKEFLRRFYNEAANNNPTLLSYPYENYISFLVSNEFVIENDETGTLALTDLGRDFLRFVIDNNLSQNLIY